MISLPKGTKDILPSESPKWRYAEEKFRECAAKFGFEEIRTPLFESTDLFQRGIGGGTDVVQKEMYTFNIAGRSLSLKPEGTAGAVRAFIENKLYAGTMPAKYYYITPCYRYEKMQKGRQREFHQFGAEVFGGTGSLADAEIIALAVSYLKSLGLGDAKLHINSIGCAKCRGVYRSALQDYFRPRLGELCETCKERFEKNPMRILDCKSPVCGEIAKDAPKMLDYLDKECEDDFLKLQEYLKAFGIEYEVDPGIVRGLDYYTKTAFEIISDKLGAQSTLCGGGRYDGLVSLLGGPEISGVGFGLGEERLLLVLEAAGASMPQVETPEVFVTGLGSEAEMKALELLSKLREGGVFAVTDLLERSLKARLKYADRIGAKKAVVIGSSELERGTALLRDMEKSEQRELPFSEIYDELTKKRK